MKIGIDVSQLAYKNTGVANYLGNLVEEMIKNEQNEFVLFFSSFRGSIPKSVLDFSKRENVRVVTRKIPPTVMNLMWNILHRFPIEKFIGKVDVFISSDWTEPPAKNAKKATIIYDMIVYKYPNETDKKIIKVQKRKLSWVKKESDIIFCISNSTKEDVKKILAIEEDRLRVIYPGMTL